MLLYIDDLLGKPYKEGARGPDYYNCYGLAIEVAKRMGHTVPDMFKLIRSDKNDLHDVNYVIDIEGLMKTETPNFGDVVIFFNSKGRVYHCGIVLKNGDMIHCNKNGVHILKITDYPRKGEFYTWLQ